MASSSLLYSLLLLFLVLISTIGVTQVKGAAMPNTEGPAPPIVVLGASYAAGLERTALAGYPLINKGVGGQQSHEMLARFQADVLDLQPGMVIIWGFINDIFRSERTAMEQTVAAVKQNYQAMVDLARSNGITPLLATEITMSRRPGLMDWLRSLIGRFAGKTSYQEYINGQVMAVNRWLHEYADQNGLILLDLQAQLADGGTMRNSRYAQPDGSHVSDEGYQVIADYLERRLKDLP
jgi:lysophospholipase L1-like esterase